WQMGVLLRTFFDLRLHRAFGFPSASRYVAERLGLSGRKARALVALERGLRRTPALAAAYREGNVSWLRALTLLPVASRDDAWVARAGEVTLRRVVAEVEWALDRRDAGLPTAPPPPGATCAAPTWAASGRTARRPTPSPGRSASVAAARRSSAPSATGTCRDGAQANPDAEPSTGRRGGRSGGTSGATSFGASGQRSAASARSCRRPTPTSNIPPT